MVDVNLIDAVEFSSGGFGAEYGDKLSSELSVRLRDGSRDRVQGDIDLSTAGIGGVIEGPLGNDGSFIASGRRSYLNLIHNLIGLTAVPNYQDAFFKATYNLSPTNTVTFMNIGGYDLISFDSAPRRIRGCNSPTPPTGNGNTLPA